MKQVLLLLALGVARALTSTEASVVVGGANPAYVCSFCLVLFGLVEQAAYQVHLQSYLNEKCGAAEGCRKAVEYVVLQAEAGKVPEEICRQSSLCADSCSWGDGAPELYASWPVNPIPAQPQEWPVERRLSSSVAPDFAALQSVVAGVVAGVQGVQAHSGGINSIPSIGIVAAALGELHQHVTAKTTTDKTTPTVGSTDTYQPCDKLNVTCHLVNFGLGHLPLVDADQDRFPPLEARRLRGSDWRGADCDDQRADVYPGSRAEHGAEVDSNCNGIWGGNDTASYEDMFCQGSGQRGLIMLGDSATAHFHIPPQWLTAAGWNIDQLLPDAENELDQPGCSWGTGHLTPQQCPYQHPVEGVDGVLSIYSQLRQRNRCNSNDFQNIGVNGARITSSMGLVDAVARAQTDTPALVWLSLIGNDVCNGHAGFEHMTTPDAFYTAAMQTLSALDAQLPKGSYVVALALFDGELLYDTMHSLQHPVGTTYDAFYSMMNCLEENPCWGWLNSDPEVRANTTAIAHSLNAQYQLIADTQSFTNFDFIFYSPDWLEIFTKHEAAGGRARDLIEPSDGFHPSQAGNALFAQTFFAWLEGTHPEALGDVNPLNGEIDALFPDLAL